MYKRQLAHTSNSFAFARVWLGGHELGEVGLYAALAAEFGVPVLMASGCDVMADELHALLPQTPCAVVKWSDGARSGRSLSAEQARSLIERMARESVLPLVEADARLPLFALPGPLALRVQCQTPALADVFALWPAVERVDGDTIAVACDNVQAALRSLNALSAMSSVLR